MPKKKEAKVEMNYGTGRRKTAVSRVFIQPGEGRFVVNNRVIEEFFSRVSSQMIAKQALEVTGMADKFDLKVTVCGGGESGQAQAVRHGVARALVDYDAELKPTLRASGLMTRDSRAVERKKPGLRKARRSRQYSKR